MWQMSSHQTTENVHFAWLERMHLLYDQTHASSGDFGEKGSRGEVG